ncbi:MAG: hypothetical protein ACI915_001778 [Gammaproteobacteria bacterium]|jgi:hypothetical protein
MFSNAAEPAANAASTPSRDICAPVPVVTKILELPKTDFIDSTTERRVLGIFWCRKGV